MPDVGRTSALYNRYVSASNPVKGPSVAHLFPDLLEVAEQLVKPGTGVLIVKLCDIVHPGRRQWQDFALVAEARRRGWTACDRAIVRNMHSRLSDDKHKAKYHTRNEWAEWLCFRNGPSCAGPGQRLKHKLTCGVCGVSFYARRADASTCSPAHRTKLYEQRHGAALALA